MKYVTTFSEVQKYRGFSPRSVLRDIALTALSFKNELFFDTSHLKTPRIQFLYIHHVFEDEIQNFQRFVEELAQHHTFISHSEAVERIWNGNIDKAYISWSSDDGFKNNLKAAEILNLYGAKAIFYLNPASIGIKSVDRAAAFCRERLFMPPIEFMDWDDVALLLKQGHEIGSHSMEHMNMATMHPAQVTADLNNSKEILSSHCGTIKHFAYPFGNYENFNKTFFDLVFSTGYQSCSSAKRGCHYGNNQKIRPSELLIRRDLVNSCWPLKHLKYVISRGAMRAVDIKNALPKSWLLKS